MTGAVLVTGASSGIGRACVERLAASGRRVFAATRDAAAVADLAARHAGRVIPVALDVTRADSIAAAAARVEEALGGATLSCLVGNAGVGYGGPVEFVPLAYFREQFEVNVFGQIAVIQAFLPLLRRHREAASAGTAAGATRIAIVGSVQGRVVTPFLAPYTCSKFALEALAGTLRQELAPWDIDVALVEPGIVKTAIFARARTFLARLTAELPPEALRLYAHAVAPFERALERAPALGLEPDLVACAIEHALTAPRPRTRYVVGLRWRLVLLLAAILPDRIWDRLVSRRGIVR